MSAAAKLWVSATRLSAVPAPALAPSRVSPLSQSQKRPRADIAQWKWTVAYTSRVEIWPYQA